MTDKQNTRDQVAESNQEAALSALDERIMWTIDGEKDFMTPGDIVDKVIEKSLPNPDQSAPGVNAAGLPEPFDTSDFDDDHPADPLGLEAEFVERDDDGSK
jgi:hypothetical protein